MRSDYITLDSFNLLQSHIPIGAKATGFRLDDVFFNIDRGDHTASYPDEPKLLINAGGHFFWVKLDENGQPNLTHREKGAPAVEPVEDASTLNELEGYFRRVVQHIAAITNTTSNPKPETNWAALQLLLQALFAETPEDQRRQVFHDVKQALEEAQAYVADHAQTLALRGITKPFARLYVVALADALLKLGVAVELDWNAGAEAAHAGVAGLLATLPGDFALPETNPSLNTAAAVAQLRQRLAAKGLALMNLDIDSDAYVLLLIKKTAAGEISALAKQCAVVLTLAG